MVPDGGKHGTKSSENGAEDDGNRGPLRERHVRWQRYHEVPMHQYATAQAPRCNTKDAITDSQPRNTCCGPARFVMISAASAVNGPNELQYMRMSNQCPERTSHAAVCWVSPFVRYCRGFKHEPKLCSGQTKLHHKVDSQYFNSIKTKSMGFRVRAPLPSCKQ